MAEAYVSASKEASPPATDDPAPLDPFHEFIDDTMHRKMPAAYGYKADKRKLHRLQRYAKQLGNRQYPFMKLIVQEHIVPGEFYFTVDTHDQLKIRPDMPDYEQWMAVKRSNFKLKRQIEDCWEKADVPTFSSIRRQTLEEKPGQAYEGEKRGLILVVDDEENEAMLIGALLEGQGFEVVRAGDGREALDRLRHLRVRPILIVLDYEMPDMDGITLIHELRCHEQTRSLPVLFATASVVDREECEAADGFLPKPFHQRDFLDLVEDMLAREKGE